jgi:UDP-GlcNAc:undecaprenyl-phosphate GlcNAc-1-phosphate transferase
MSALVVVGLCSLIVTLVLTPFFRDFFGFLDMVDQPDARRKLHLRPIPRVGGIPVAISYVAVLSAMLIAASLWKEMFEESGPSILLLWRLLPAVIIVFATGLLDDFFGLSPWQKIAGQFLAAGWAVWAGVRLAPIGNPIFDALIIPMSLAWLVFCTNAFNLIDGLDGLASGVALLGAISLLMAALIHHHPVLSFATVPLVGGLIGFLYYNFNPASVFLGDCGSLLIGFLLGCFGLMWNQKASSGLGGLAPLMAIAVPAVEVGLSVVRRFLRLRPIFDADRNHIHHRLLSLGFPQKKVALILYAAAALAATMAFLQTILQPRAGTVLFVLFLTVTYYGIHRLGYAEFSALGRLLVGGDLRRVLRMRICLQEFEQSLSTAQSPEQCWEAVREVCSAAGLVEVRLHLDGHPYEWNNGERLPEKLGRLQFPLSSADDIVVVQDLAVRSAGMWIAPIVEALDEKLKRTSFISPDRPKAMAAAAS